MDAVQSPNATYVIGLRRLSIQPTPLVCQSFHRSLCKAAAIQQLLTLVTRAAQRVLRYVPCASTLLSWANKAAKYAIAYTIAFIGIYGLNFNEGACLGALVAHGAAAAAGAAVRSLLRRSQKPVTRDCGGRIRRLAWMVARSHFVSSMPADVAARVLSSTLCFSVVRLASVPRTFALLVWPIPLRSPPDDLSHVHFIERFKMMVSILPFFSPPFSSCRPLTRAWSWRGVLVILCARNSDDHEYIANAHSRWSRQGDVPAPRRHDPRQRHRRGGRPSPPRAIRHACVSKLGGGNSLLDR